MTAPTELDERALEAACAATVLGEDADGKPVHLEPQEAATAIRAYLSAIPASEAGWQPIETVPEDDTLFLAYCPPDDEFPDGRTMIWKGSIFAYQKKPTPRHLQFPATHWMPLPSAPDRRAAEASPQPANPAQVTDDVVEALEKAKHELWEMGATEAEGNALWLVRCTLASIAGWNRRPPATELYGPFGWLNGHRALSEDSWTLESDPLENSDEYFAIPLYALTDPFKEVGLSTPPLTAAIGVGGQAVADDDGAMTPGEVRLEDLKQMAAYDGPIVSFDVREPYYLASCNHCGWVGSSERCGTDSFGDDSDVYCPRCHASGADCGKVASALSQTHPADEPPAGSMHPLGPKQTIISEVWGRLERGLCRNVDRSIIEQGVETALHVLRREGVTLRSHPAEERVVEALREAADRFDEIRVILIEHMEEPQRTAFWKAVNGREFCRHALAKEGRS